MTNTQKQILTVLIVVWLLCIVLMIVSNFLSIATRDAVLEVSKWGFTTVLGAIVGSAATFFGTSGQDKTNSRS